MQKNRDRDKKLKTEMREGIGLIINLRDEMEMDIKAQKIKYPWL